MTSLTRPRRWAFVDETFRDPAPALLRTGYYQLAAVMLEDEHVDALRRRLVAEFGRDGPFKASALARDGRRDVVETMLDTVCAADCFNLVVVRGDHQVGQEAARQACLERLLVELSAQHVLNVVLDSREAVVGRDPQARNKRDLATRRSLARARRIHRRLTIAHEHDDEEELLWIPDAVGWAHRRHLLNDEHAIWDRVAAVASVLTVT